MKKISAFIFLLGAFLFYTPAFAFVPAQAEAAPYMDQVHAFLARPDRAFLLMTLGLYGLIYELVSPGAFLPGITGGILLLLGVFAINGMPINYFGLLLMIVGIGTMTAEAFLKTRGALGIAGAVSFAIGSWLFINPPLPGVSPWLIGSMTLIGFGLLSVGLKLILRTQKRAVSTGAEALQNATGEVIHWSHGKGEVMAAGSAWKARAAADATLKKGDKVKILEVDGLCLVVQPVH